MIQQFAELGEFYLRKEDVQDQLKQYTCDPSAKFRTNTVILLVFTARGFERTEVEEYDATRRLSYLYRPGPPNGWDATPTVGLPGQKNDTQGWLEEEVRKKLARLGKCLADAVRQSHKLPEWESTALDAIGKAIGVKIGAETTPQEPAADVRATITAAIQGCHPDLKQPVILSIAYRTQEDQLRRVGDFEAFRQALVRFGTEAASKKGGIEGDVRGSGQCSICGKRDTEVSGLLQIQQFKIYTLDKPGSVSGGFNPENAWRNFPACRECCDRVDFAGERVKKELSFDFYGFKYLLLPLPVQPIPSQAFELLDRLVSARVDNTASKRLTDAEKELFYVIAEEEQNRLQVDLLFYQPDPQSFRPKLYVAGLLPSRFRRLFEAKDAVDEHPWLKEPSPNTFTSTGFTFRSLRRVLPAEHGGSTFDDDFIAATRAALELRAYPTERLLELGMRWVQQDYIEGKAWPFRLADLFRSLLFFERLTADDTIRRTPVMTVDYGDSEQADRVRKVFSQAPERSRLRVDASAQAAFLIGACCGRIETIQENVRGSTPFSGKLKGFRLSQVDVHKLFLAAKDKAQAYGADQERKVSGLLGCAAAALLASPDEWPLSPDEVSYYFALGHALRPRLAKERDESSVSPNGSETQE